MMKKSWKNRSGVSPVIATILMVAITVVLAAVLYVMVMGFNNGGNQTPTVTLAKTQTGSDTDSKTYKVYVLSVSGGSVATDKVQAVLTTATTTDTAVQKAVSTSTNLAAGDFITIDVLNADAGKNVVVMFRDSASGNQLGQLTFVA